MIASENQTRDANAPANRPGGRGTLLLTELAERLLAAARTRNFAIALAAVLLVALVGVRVYFASQASYPGHADSNRGTYRYRT